MNPGRRLLLVTAVPPPIGGVGTWTRHVLASPIAREFDVVTIDTGTVGASGAGSRLFARKLATNSRVVAAVAVALASRRRGVVVHANTSPTRLGILRTGVIARLARLAGVPCVIHLHGGRFVDLDDAGHGAEAARLLRAASLVYVLDAPTEERLRRLEVEPVRVIPNFLPTTQVQRTEGAPGVLRALFVGWMIEAKGIFDLLEALAVTEGVHVTFVGRFVEDASRTVERRFRERIAELSLSDRVDVVGEVSSDEVSSYYARADVLVLPSWTEGLPFVVLEAMMAGLPVLSTRVGALPEVLEHGKTGLLVEPQDPQALAAGLARLRDNTEEATRIGAAARVEAVSRYSVEAVTAQMLRDYASLLAQRS